MHPAFAFQNRKTNPVWGELQNVSFWKCS